MQTTIITGIIGKPLAHSLSPIIHNACFKQLSLDWQYIPFEVEPEAIDCLLKFARKSNIAGFNVTMPYKEMITGFLDELSHETLKIGAVNTVKILNGRAAGYNTDAGAIIRILKEQYGKSPKGKSVVLIGAGGAARAVAYAAHSLGCKKLAIINRTRSKAKRLKNDFKEEFDQINLLDEPGDMKNAVESSDIIINATPVGMFPETGKLPINIEYLKKGQFIMDLIYHPAETNFIKEAKQMGIKAVGGMPMFIYQAAESFKIWTGINPPQETMAAVVKDFFGE